MPATDLAEQVRSVQWYHSLDLGNGVVTPGWFDLRSVAPRVPWPPLAGKRCLDVGTFDGFWAFEMERRGAAEVVAIDLLDPARWDWPTGSESAVVDAIGARKGHGDGFLIAAAAIGSAVTRHDLSVYDVSAQRLGRFDVVYVGSLLLHLRDPVAALARLLEVCAGTLIVVDAIDLPLTLRHPRRPVAAFDGRGRPWWWRPNLRGLMRMVEAAGFTVASTNRVRMPAGPAQSRSAPLMRVLRDRTTRQLVAHARAGDPHAIVVARPSASRGG